MRLNDYVLKLARFPDYPPIVPFASWSTTSPTRSLQWYDAYNNTKHDRSSNFSDANLANVISAVGACLVMQAAQFGYMYANRCRELFVIESYAQWPESDVYHLDHTAPSQFQQVDHPL